jgi:hypothetical protein
MLLGVTDDKTYVFSGFPRLRLMRRPFVADLAFWNMRRHVCDALKSVNREQKYVLENRVPF